MQMRTLRGQNSACRCRQETRAQSTRAHHLLGHSTNHRRKMMHNSLEYPGWLLFIWLLIGQGLPAFNYELGVRMGTQDSADVVTEVGVAFWKGFAFADMLFYIPLLGFALATYDEATQKNQSYLAAALGITVYWPVVCLKAAISARGAPGWSLDDRPFLLLLPVIILWAAWQLFCLEKDLRKDKQK